MQKFYLGMDVCAEYTQLSFFNQQTYLLTNVAFFGKEKGQWYIGSDAL